MIQSIRLVSGQKWITVGENEISRIEALTDMMGFRIYKNGILYDEINDNDVDKIRYY